MLRLTLVTATSSLLLAVGCSNPFSSEPSEETGLWMETTGVVLEPGETLALTALFKLSVNDLLAPLEDGYWRSDDEDVVRVIDPSAGEIEAVGSGATAIWVETGALRDSASVTVSEAEAPAHRWREVSVGRHSLCALDDLGRAYCWGWDFYGRWGQGGERRLWTQAHRRVRVASDLVFEQIG